MKNPHGRFGREIRAGGNRAARPSYRVPYRSLRPFLLSGKEKCTSNQRTNDSDDAFSPHFAIVAPPRMLSSNYTSMNEIEELLERFRRGPEVMAAVLTGAAGSEVDFHPQEGEWSVRQIVAHVADSEVAATFRFRRMIAEPNPTLEAFDGEAWAEHLDYARRKPSQSLETFRRLRQENYELLHNLDANAFSRTAHHTERGTITLLELVKLLADHPESHARQIQRVRDAFKAKRSAGAQQ
jgi:hypothetical protein